MIKNREIFIFNKLEKKNVRHRNTFWLYHLRVRNNIEMANFQMGHLDSSSMNSHQEGIYNFPFRNSHYVRSEA